VVIVFGQIGLNVPLDTVLERLAPAADDEEGLWIFFR
jgi:hypothetical protein